MVDRWGVAFLQWPELTAVAKTRGQANLKFSIDEMAAATAETGGWTSSDRKGEGFSKGRMMGGMSSPSSPTESSSSSSTEVEDKALVAAEAVAVEVKGESPEPTGTVACAFLMRSFSNSAPEG